jgi:hypothetical protein
MIRCSAFAMLLLAISAATVHADDTDVTPPGAPAAVDETHPIYSSDARWVAGVLVAIGGLFLAALVVGRVVRAEAMETAPSAISHEEEDGADRAEHSTPPESR